MTDTLADPVSAPSAYKHADFAHNTANWPGGDLYQSALAWRLWTMLGWNDIRLRYRRSVLGPFWMTLSMSVLIIVLGVLYSQIFHMAIRTYLPYVALGFIFWGFISAAINESCNAFLEGEKVIKQLRMPFSVFVMRTVWRNFIVMLHTLVLIVPIDLIFGRVPQPAALLVIPGLALLYLNLVWMGAMAAILSTRYRDVPQIIATILQVTVFATPIMWPVSSLGDHTIVADANPFYHLIQLVRAPLLGETPALLSWAVALVMAAFGTLVAALLFRRAANRIVYWL